jgi:flagellar hook assembly protein FlgD
MFATTASRAARGSASRSLVLLAALLAVVFIVSFTSLGSVARGATSSSHAGRAPSGTTSSSAAATAGKKAVIVVGPVGSETADYIQAARDMGAVLTAAGLDVNLVLSPHATWANVIAVANGAAFFAYLGHGNGWPSPYAPFQEDSKNGLGLNPSDGDASSTKYYGRCYFLGGVDQSPNCTPGKNYGGGIHLANNAVGLFNRLCYADGNGEPGMAVPTQDVAFQRADNFSSTLLAAGARTVFALGWQPGVDLARALVNEHKTMEGFFESRDATNGDPHYLPYHGWVGWKPAVYIDSVRTPGAVVHLDPDQYSGYLRSVAGDLDFTTDMWRSDGDPNDTTDPVLTDVTGTQASNTVPADSSSPTVFTPNGDGISDVLTFKHTLSEPSYLDVSIANSSGSIVRHYTGYSAEGTTSETWNGKNNAGVTVSDGRFDITITPTDRADNHGTAKTLTVKVMTAMRAPSATPGLFYAADGDALAATQTQKVTLDKPSTLTWKVTQLDGTVVRTAMTNEAHGVGVVSWVWDGMDDSGNPVANGAYWMVVTSDTSAGTYSHRVQVRQMPFKVTANKLIATAGTNITLTVATAETQTGWVKLSVKQPGLAKYSVSLAKWSNILYKGSFILKSGGTPGQVVLTFTGTDTGGGTDVQTMNITLN